MGKKVIVVLLMVSALLCGCGGGVSEISQEEYDKVVAERDKLQKSYDELWEKYSSEHAKNQVESLKNEIRNDIDSRGEDIQTEEVDLSINEREGLDTESQFPFEYISSGQYKVGTDMEPGEYVLLSEDGDAFFSVDSDANGKDIVFNGNFAINSIITVNDGEFLELRRCIAVKYDDFYPSNSIKIELEGIMIKIGNEIEEGEYKIEGEDGFYSIYSDSRQKDIISNGSIDGSGYIQVKAGQYLELRRCKIAEKTS